LHQAYGFDLATLIERRALALCKRGNAVYAVPEQFLARFEELPCAAVGLLIGELSDGFTPSHEFLARFGAQCAGRRWTIPDHLIGKWLAGYDLREIESPPYPIGTVMLVEDDRGRFVGRGKVLSNRVRNMLPKK
jgi:NOL1/NOP2/fmu family ribosome biogenesis protein